MLEKKNMAPGKKGGSGSKGKGGFQLLHLIMIAIIALIIGGMLKTKSL